MWEDLKKSEKSTTYSADYTVGGLKFDALGATWVPAGMSRSAIKTSSFGCNSTSALFMAASGMVNG